MTRRGFDLEGVTPIDTDGVPPGIHPTAVIGSPPEMRTWRERMRVVAPFIHETARIGPLATVDGGYVSGTSIGARSWCLAHSHIGHDAIVMCDVEISSGAIIGGHVVVMNGARVGLGAVVLPHRVIGPGALVGAGAVVTKDVPAGEVWAGNPAQPVANQNPDREVKVDADGTTTTVGQLQSRRDRAADSVERLRAELANPTTPEMAAYAQRLARDGQMPSGGDEWGHSSDAPREGEPIELGPISYADVLVRNRSADDVEARCRCAS